MAYGSSSLFCLHLLCFSVLILSCLHFSPGLMFLSAPLDYESQRLHRLTVQAVDHGLPSLSSTQTFTMEVGDVNDQSPIFSQSIYNASVAENRDPGEPVTRVSATDGDSGKKGLFAKYHNGAKRNLQFFLVTTGKSVFAFDIIFCQEYYEKAVILSKYTCVMSNM